MHWEEVSLNAGYGHHSISVTDEWADGLAWLYEPADDSRPQLKWLKSLCRLVSLPPAEAADVITPTSAC